MCALALALTSPLAALLLLFLGGGLPVGIEWLPAALLLLGISGMALIALLRTNKNWVRIISSVALAIAIGAAALVSGSVASMIDHDETMGRYRDIACDTAPGDSRILQCGTSIENPSNGNSCGYFVDIVLESTASVDFLRDFYESRQAVTPDSGRYWGQSVDVEIISDDQRAITVETIGEEGDDSRCI